MKKSIWIIGYLGLGLLLFSSTCVVGRSYTNRILLGQNITPVAMEEQSSESNTSDDDSWPTWNPAFSVLVACAIGLSVLNIVRKIIVVAYGYKKIRIPVSSYDRISLSEIARNQTSHRRRRFFDLINTFIYVLVIGLLASFFLTVVIELHKAGFGRFIFQILKELLDKIGR